MSRKYFMFAAAWALCLPAHALQRAPAMADQFYPADPKALSSWVDRLFKEEPGAPAEGVVALLVPHAAIEYSGAAAAKAYKLLRRGSFDSVIVVGTAHHKLVEGAALYPGDYAVPGAALPYDAELAAALMRASPLIVADAAAHEKEHSIEVQVPFLNKALGPVKMVALVMNTQDLEAQKAVGAALAQACRGKRVLLVASSDLSHYPNGATADAVDQTTLAALSRLDTAYFWLTNRLLMNRGLPDLSVTYCGEGAVAAVMEAARRLGAVRVQPLARLNSGDVVSERKYDHVVGYAAASFLRSGKPLARAFDLSSAEKAELLALARAGVAAKAAGGKTQAPAFSPRPKFNLPAAVFVTLRGAGGALRGCIGVFSPQESLAESVARNAAASAAEDPRFPPVAADELSGLRVEISILSPMRAVKDAGEIKRGDGVALELGERGGIFLPQVWDQIKDKGAFLEELCSQKAGAARDCYKDPAARFEVFSAETFEEPAPSQDGKN